MTEHIRSCFIGIPLPATYSKRFALLLDTVHIHAPFLRTVSPHTPHITIAYIGETTPEAIKEIKHAIETKAFLLQQTTICLEGMSWFAPHAPRVLYVPVKQAEPLFHFHAALALKLDQHIPDDKKPYVPHLTIARRIPKKGERITPALQSQLASIFASVHWEFPITHVSIYGILQAGSEQKKIKTIRLTKPKM